MSAHVNLRVTGENPVHGQEEPDLSAHRSGNIFGESCITRAVILLAYWAYFFSMGKRNAVISSDVTGAPASPPPVPATTTYCPPSLPK
jgi:hypothetical protein